MIYRKPLIFMKPNGGASGASRQKGGGVKTFTSEKGVFNTGQEKASEITNLIMKSPVGTEITRTYTINGVEQTAQGRITVNRAGYKYLSFKDSEGRKDKFPFNSTNVFTQLVWLGKKVTLRQTPLTQAEKDAPKITETREIKRSSRATKPKNEGPNIPTEMKITERRRWQNPEWEGRGDKENPRYMTSETTHRLQVYPRAPARTAKIDWLHGIVDSDTGKVYYQVHAAAPEPTKPFQITHGELLGYVSEKSAKVWEREYKREHGEYSTSYQFLKAPYGIREGRAH